jgi:hypothetical protein
MNMDQETSHRLHELCERKREVRLRRAALDTDEAVIDNEIIKITGKSREGSTRVTNGLFRVVTTGKLNRKILPDELAQIVDHIPTDLSPFVSKTVLDMKRLRALETANPELYKFCCRAIEAKDGKPNVKVEVADA